MNHIQLQKTNVYSFFDWESLMYFLKKNNDLDYVEIVKSVNVDEREEQEVYIVTTTKECV